jgi:hypothetical protein
VTKLAKRLVAPEAIEAGLVCPDHWSGPDWVYTDGPAVTEINARAGFEPDPQQQLALDLIFAVDENWLPAAFSVCVICARQNLKTGTLKQAVVGWLSVTGERKIVWSSHEMSTTLEAQNEIHDLLESSPALSKLLPATKNRGKYADNGGERIETTTGQSVLFKARTQSGGRGLAGDKTILDEALFLKPVHTASLLPIMLARPTGQVIYASSPGLLESAVLRDVRDRGRTGSSPRMFYLEWGGHWRDCADPDCTHPKDAEARGIDCAADDRELWRKNNPTVSTGRITLERIADLRQELTPDDFIRECQGQWEDPDQAAGSPAIDARLWRRLGDKSAPAPRRAVVNLVVAPDRSRGSIGVVGDGPDGKALGMVHVRPWRELVTVLTRLRSNIDVLEVSLHPSSQAGVLIPELKAAGIGFKPLVHQDLARGCAATQMAVIEERLMHLDQAEVSAAVAVARTRYVNEAEVWDQRDHRLEISPIVAISTALHRWDLATARPKTPPAPPRRAAGRTAPAGAGRRTLDPATAGF